jgi:hypothetical protein
MALLEVGHYVFEATFSVFSVVIFILQDGNKHNLLLADLTNFL